VEEIKIVFNDGLRYNTLMNTIKFLFLMAGLLLMVAGHWILALICFAIAIGLTFIISLGLLFVGIITVLMLTGCGTFVKTDNIYIDNSAVNNYVGNPCAFYLGDRCLIWKTAPTPRNPNNPYKENK
jgi:uncharacterized membrane protein YjjP (DUF1212 family)